MNNIELSFCIPTFNRAVILHRLVINILSCSDPCIEVVVMDNGSTDGTLDILRTVKDERLVVFSNGENKGALFNMVNVLNKGRGKFLVYSTDQDHIDFNEITTFKSFLLQTPELAGGYCAFNSIAKADYEILPKGYQAIKRIAYQGRHPTGYFFNNEMLKSIKLVERFSDYDFVDLFPLEFVFAELCLMGDGAIYHRSIFKPETGEMVVKHKSSTTNGKSKKAFFSPEARLKMAINYTKHIHTLKISPKEKETLTINVFFYGLNASTIGYKSILNNEDLCIHYGMESREVKIKELFSIGLNFYTQFINSALQSLGKSYTEQLDFSISLCNIIFKKIFNKLSKIHNFSI